MTTLQKANVKRVNSVYAMLQDSWERSPRRKRSFDYTVLFILLWALWD